MSNLVLRQSKGDASQIAVDQVRVGFYRRQTRLRPSPFDLNGLAVGDVEQ